MDQLQQARTEIDRIDKEMADLFCRRMNAVAQVAEYKKQHGLPIQNQAREQAVIEQNAAEIADETVRSFYVRFLQDVMDVSKAYQYRLNEGMKVAYSGVEGAFAHIASGRIFPTAQLISFGDFQDAYQAVCSGECDAAVLPVENSYAGEVGQVMDLTFSGPLFISGIYELAVTHHLLGLPGADKNALREVFSHPQALSQCAPYIKAHHLTGRSFANTAMAAQHVAQVGDPSLAAIASEETAALYGLCVLERGINSSRGNTTRFAVFTRVAHRPLCTKANHFILTYTVKNEAGALTKTIHTIGKYGFNMCSLRSRPMKELLWQYYFYIEAEGDLQSPQGQAMLQELAPLCDQLKVAGTFANHGELKQPNIR